MKRTRLNKLFDALRLWRKMQIAFVVLTLLCLSSPSGAAQETASPLYGGRTLSQWQEVIKSTDFRTLGQPEYVHGLLEIVRDSNAPWGYRRFAAETLGRIGSDAQVAVPVLHEILRSPPGDAVSTRLWVLKALSLFREVAAETREDVGRIVLDPEQPLLVRVNAMETLARVGKNHEETLPTLLKVLRLEPSPNSPLDVEVIRNLRVAAAEALWILGPSAAAAIPDLIKAARDDWTPLRLSACVTLGQIGPRAEIAVPTLVDILLFDEAGEVQEAAADALGNIGSPALPALAHLIQDREKRVRLLALRALALQREDQRPIEIAQTALNDDSPRIRHAAADFIVQRRPDHDAAQHVLLNLLASSERRARLEAYRTLESLLPKAQRLASQLAAFVETPGSHPEAVRYARKLLKKREFDSE